MAGIVLEALSALFSHHVTLIAQVSLANRCGSLNPVGFGEFLPAEGAFVRLGTARCEGDPTYHQCGDSQHPEFPHYVSFHDWLFDFLDLVPVCFVHVVAEPPIHMGLVLVHIVAVLIPIAREFDASTSLSREP